MNLKRSNMTKKFLILCFWLLCYSVAKCQDEQSIDKDAERREGNAQDGGNGRNIVLFITISFISCQKYGSIFTY